MASTVVMMASSVGGGSGGNGDGGESSKKRGTIDESERKFTPEERKVAEKLADEGKDLKALPEKNPQGVRNPDALVDGKPAEFKTPDPGADSTLLRTK